MLQTTNHLPARIARNSFVVEVCFNLLAYDQLLAYDLAIASRYQLVPSSFYTGRFKYECNHCGECACSKCSTTLVPIHKFGLHEPVQVCDFCKVIIEGCHCRHCPPNAPLPPSLLLLLPFSFSPSSQMLAVAVGCYHAVFCKL